jgi:hypothetical protein
MLKTTRFDPLSISIGIDRMQTVARMEAANAA